MKYRLLFPALLSAFVLIGQTTQSTIDQIYQEALSSSPVYPNLEYLCKKIGNRLSGSPAAAAAVAYTRQLMIDYGFDTVFLQPVMVPHWERGNKEIVRITQSNAGQMDLKALALGNSIGTGPNGIRAQVIEVSGMDEVEKQKDKLKGKIVFFNGPMEPANYHTFQAYGNAVIQRAYGASEAAKYGALAVIIRSMTQALDDEPHTGSLRYKPNMPQIPAVAISTRDADRLSQQLKHTKPVEIYIETHCRMLEPVQSYNVIGQLNGSEHPDSYLSVGGHLDSWDVGEGAHDDGAGCMQGIEALRLLRTLGLAPRHTIRAVMWINEENGGAGGTAYAQQALQNGEKHVAAIESDRGGFLPIGFTSTGTDEQKARLAAWREYFLPWGLHSFDLPGGGADIGPLAQQGTFLIGLLPDGQRYFRYHHTAADVFETVDRRELELGAASMAALLYLIDQESW
ncbi:MAG: M20/M25/M40 family metallo-hydrolase [Cyclobacteriaceae bacterium]|nr:M20/M25/M40 family metallo-hydrolase [Cyclobacteriaceae bacterium]